MNKRRSRTAISSANGAQKIPNKQITFTTNPIIDIQIPKETSSGGFEPVALENFEFENRQIRNINETLSHSRSIKTSK